MEIIIGIDVPSTKVKTSLISMKNSAYLGHVIKNNVALKRATDHLDAISKLIQHDLIKPEPKLITNFKELFNQWKNYKAKNDNL